MQRISRPEGLDIPTPQLQRNQSRSSDRDHTPSISGASSLLSPPSVKPDPAYIAASAASQIVNSDLANRDEAFDSGGKQSESDTVVVSPASLILLNAFLDQLLFSFLASSRSTSIAALRPAILEILKPRLGKEAIDGADEELQGYLAGGDAEELLAFHGGWGFKGDHNLNLVWRRTRLRCMVYTRLGDMEEEDEETYLEQELEENGIDGRPRLTRDLGEISPAAAIFLTSIVEFIGEHSLLVAGEAAYNRFQTKKPTSDRHRPMVEELDMEKIAFNPSLGRLWRSWKKRVRNSTLLSPRPMSRELQRHKSSSLPGEDHSRKNNVSEDSYFDPARRPSVGEVLHEDRELSPDSAPDAVVLPEESDFHNMSTTENTDARAEETIQTTRNRPHSMIEYQMQRSESTIHTPTQDFVPKLFSGPRTGGARPTPKHMRSSSLPAKQTPYVSPIDETFTTPSEGPDPFVCEDDRANAEKEMPRLTDDSKMVPGLAGGDHAVSTMYDGAISQDDEVLPKGMAERTNRGLSTYTESSTTDEYDHEMTPQPLESNNMTENAPSETPGSRPSTVSTDYSFHVGEKDHVASPGGLGQDHVSKEIINEEEGAFPSRADSFDQSGVEPETGRQHIGNFANLATLQEQQLRTYDNSGKAVKRDIPVLYEAPSNEDVIYNPHASVRSSAIHEEEEVTTSKRADTAGAISQQGVPPLTPLRDLLDAAHDTSDEASSIAPSYGTPRSETFVPFLGSDSQRIPSYTSSNSNNAQPSTSTSKLIDLRGQPSTVNTGTERAAVQRVSPTTSSPLTPTGRTSTSTNCDVRPATSCSTGSQVSSKIKGLIGRESGDLIRQPIPHRTSSADSGSLISGQLRTPRSVDKEMDFEDLIKSDETVKYTLTPQNMREMEVCFF